MPATIHECTRSVGNPQHDLYREIEELATTLGRWRELRPELLATLAKRAPSLKIEIHLGDGELDDAIAAVRGRAARASSYLYNYDMRLKVAEAAEEARPDAAIEIYQSFAERRIDLRGRDNYQTAARTLARARDIYDRTGRFEEWEQYIERLRTEHARLWALREDLDAEGL